MNTSSIWGIDLGGTKIEGVVLDTVSGTPLLRRRIATEAEGGYDHIIDRVRQLVESLRAETGLSPTRLGIGTPGVIDPHSGRLKNSNTLCLNNRPLRDDLAHALGLEVRLANDANCFALAEATFGAARGYRTVFGIILGTGVGGGVVIDGQPLHGRHGIAGEWGHNLLEPDGLPCYCGRRGCVEAIISGPALERFYAERTGQKWPLHEIARRAGSDDPDAKATLQHLQRNFAKALAGVLNILDPEAVVIGGGVGHIPLLYSDATRREIERHLFHPVLETPILPPALGDSAGVFGAAMLVADIPGAGS